MALLREMVANHFLSTFSTANIYMPVQCYHQNLFKAEKSFKKKKREMEADHLCCPHSTSILPNMLAFGCN